MSVSQRENEFKQTVIDLKVEDAATGSWSSVEVYLYGAHITMWEEKGKPKYLFLSSKAKLDGTKPIRGGIPLVFPQFGGFGPLPQHGFARNAIWTLVADKTSTGSDFASITLSLSDSEATRASKWPHEFETQFTITLRRAVNSELEINWKVLNKSSTDATIYWALHTYFTVGDINQTSVCDLRGLTLLDALKNRAEAVEDRDEVVFGQEVDRVYVDTPSVLHINDRANSRRFVIEKSSAFPDAVVWNPWIVRIFYRL
jgi:glucose-6-phosphate 1-epimerase